MFHEENGRGTDDIRKDRSRTGLPNHILVGVLLVGANESIGCGGSRADEFVFRIRKKKSKRSPGTARGLDGEKGRQCLLRC